MKILYTKKFKEALSQPWKRLSLGKVKLRGGTNISTLANGRTSKQDLLDGDEFLKNHLTTRTYDSEIIRYKDGIQIYLEVESEDASLYDEKYFYQVILFYYTDSSTDETSLAFVLYNNLGYTEDDPDDERSTSSWKFSGLRLTSKNNIFTIPGFFWRCNLEFGQSQITKFIEDPWSPQQDKRNNNLKTNGILSQNDGYISLESWKQWMVDQLSEPDQTPWLETTYLNKYGIKIY